MRGNSLNHARSGRDASMRTDDMRLVGMLVLLLVCPMVYSQDKGAAREASVFTGGTVDVPPFLSMDTRKP
jgi:hypothetical protein